MFQVYFVGITDGNSSFNVWRTTTFIIPKTMTEMKFLDCESAILATQLGGGEVSLSGNSWFWEKTMESLRVRDKILLMMAVFEQQSL